MQGKTISKFDGTEHRFLSNFWPSPVSYEGVEYPTVENAYQAAKTLNLSDRNHFVSVSPGKAKKMGGLLFSIREDWDKVKYSIMLALVCDKFTYDEKLQKDLLNTGASFLVEGNTWDDVYWGVCKGIGKNNLGKVLMTVRYLISLQNEGRNYSAFGWKEILEQ